MTKKLKNVDTTLCKKNEPFYGKRSVMNAYKKKTLKIEKTKLQLYPVV